MKVRQRSGGHLRPGVSDLMGVKVGSNFVGETGAHSEDGIAVVQECLFLVSKFATGDKVSIEFVGNASRVSHWGANANFWSVSTREVFEHSKHLLSNSLCRDRGNSSNKKRRDILYGFGVFLPTLILFLLREGKESELPRSGD